MSRLPGTENWSEAEVRHRIAFLEKLSDNTPSLVAEMAKASGYQNPERFADRPTDAIYTLVEATELAFAIDDVGLGLALCEKVADHLKPNSTAMMPMQIILAATAGAIAGVVEVVLHPDVVLVIRGEDLVSAFGLASPSSRYNLALFQRAAYAALASGRFEPSPLAGEGDEQRASTWRSFATTLEGRMFSQARTAIDLDEPVLALIASDLGRAYDDRLIAQHADKISWQRFIARGGLIDWRLLAIETGAALRSIEGPPFERLSIAGSFLRDTAWSITQWRRDRRFRE